MLSNQEPASWDPIQLKRKFVELIDESILVEIELSDLKRQKKEWKEERNYLINKLVAVQNSNSADQTNEPVRNNDVEYRYNSENSSYNSLKSSKADTVKFSPSIVAILDSWFTTHSENPYPSKEEKEALASQTGLATKKVENWFINARRRRMKQTGIPSTPYKGNKNRAPKNNNNNINNNNNNNNNNNKNNNNSNENYVLSQDELNDNDDNENTNDEIHENNNNNLHNMNDDMLDDHSAIFDIHNLPDFDGSNII
jgi:hypothetical protein